jgi:hypothetical protein
MQPKKLPVALAAKNLLNDLEFTLHLKFEATYAGSVRGGHSPIYFGQRKRKQLVNSNSLLHEPALKELSSKILSPLN